ncbi:hypothetical protein [Euzebya tangerina]|uniref:hypothetical protein n=1 Tax=Euzebya tangerina TaxID=591198 RepID=UPI0013C31534|nr:hypothetical protein [Euzebya tangerina]
MTDPVARNPQAEATRRLGDGRLGLVLEPSAPAVDVGPWFADDPTVPTDDDGRVGSVGPTSAAGSTWDEVVVARPELGEWASTHWLGGVARVGPAPTTLEATRSALTALAFTVIATVRHQHTGKIGLRWTKGGFGTPFFADDRQVRVEGTDLVVQVGDTVQSEPISTLAAAGRFVDVEPGAPEGIDFHDMPSIPALDEPLTVDAEAVGFLDSWFGFGTLVLELLRDAAGRPSDTRVQLWPEHFDPAIELGDADAGTRASFGASPGDDAVGEPYLYVAPWTTQEGPFWSTPFGGAALTLHQLLAAEDQVEAAAVFFRSARTLLSSE